MLQVVPARGVANVFRSQSFRMLKMRKRSEDRISLRSLFSWSPFAGLQWRQSIFSVAFVLLFVLYPGKRVSAQISLRIGVLSLAPARIRIEGSCGPGLKS